MSTRRPNVPRAPKSAQTEADVLRPAFGVPKTATSGQAPASARGTGDPAAKSEAAPADSKEPAPAESVGRAPAAGAGRAPSDQTGRAPSEGSPRKNLNPGSAGNTLRAKARPISAAARRVQERESARYSVRQPVIGWTKGEVGAEHGARTKDAEARPAARSNLPSGTSTRGTSALGTFARGTFARGTAGAGTAGAGTPGAGTAHAAQPRSTSGSDGGPPRETADPSPVPAKSFSGRLLALTVVLITITVLLAPSVQTYVQQREELATLSAEIATQEATRSELQNNLARWEDPAYVKQQARNRLFLVMPGETRYLVMGAEELPELAQDPGSEAQAADVPWVDALWQSIQRSATE